MGFTTSRRTPIDGVAFVDGHFCAFVARQTVASGDAAVGADNTYWARAKLGHFPCQRHDKMALTIFQRARAALARSALPYC